MPCEVCKTRFDLLTCGHDGQPMLDFCHEHMVDYLEQVHPQNRLAQGQAKTLRRKLRQSERALLQLLKDKQS